MQVYLKIVTIKLPGKTLKKDLQQVGKLTYKYVKGGVKLVETDFTIKESDLLDKLE